MENIGFMGILSIENNLSSNLISNCTHTNYFCAVKLHYQISLIV